MAEMCKKNKIYYGIQSIFTLAELCNKNKNLMESSLYLSWQRYVIRKIYNGIQSIFTLAEICNKKNLMESSLYLPWQGDQRERKYI